MNARLRKWLIISIGTLVIFCSIGLTTATFSIYLPYFINDYGFANTQTSFLVSIRTMSAFIFMLSVTKYFNLLSLRTGMAISLLSSALSFVLMAQTTNYYFICLAVCVLGSTYTFASMYPLTLLMNRWFGEKSAVPLSISSCGSGLAAIFAPSVITYIIETFGIGIAFYVVASLIAVTGALVWLFIKDSPPNRSEAATQKSTSSPSLHKFRVIPKHHFYLLMLAVSFNGSLTLAGWGHFAVLFKTNNYSSMETAYALSLGGLMLTISKFFYGFITERIHTFKSNFIFCTLINIGFLLCIALPSGYRWLPATMAIFTGLGAPISTLGVCMWAKEISPGSIFPDNLRKLQTCHLFGGLLFSNAPGIIADITGSYIPSYMLFSLLGLLSFTIIQSIYIKNKIYEIYD